MPTWIIEKEENLSKVFEMIRRAWKANNEKMSVSDEFYSFFSPSKANKSFKFTNKHASDIFGPTQFFDSEDFISVNLIFSKDIKGKGEAEQVIPLEDFF